MQSAEFTKLTAFVAVADQRSFARAAAQLGVATSTLSQTIRSLEEHLGVRLLNRTTRSVSPTEAGERLLAQLQPALDHVHRALETVNDFRDKPFGTLRLTTTRAAAMVLVAPLIKSFLAAYPEITLELAIDESNSDIVSGRYDAGIRLGERIDSDMIAMQLSNHVCFSVVASPDYLAARSRPQTPDDLRGHNCLRHRSAWDGAIQPWLFERDGATIEVAVQGSYIVNELDLLVRAAVDGIGIAQVPTVLARPWIERRKLVPVLKEWYRQYSGLYLYYPSRRQVPPPLQVFIDFLRDARRGRDEAAEVCQHPAVATRPMAETAGERMGR
jgi:DNA-binding transcriptional LysR family regulator